MTGAFWNESWRKMGSRPLGSHFVFSIRYDRYHLLPDDKEREFVVIESRDWVNVIPITADGHVVLVRQYRHGVESPSLEIPGGVIDEGESPLQAAQRELSEETGYQGERVQFLGSTWPNPALQNNQCHFFAVWDVELQGALVPDEFERIEVVLKPLAEVPALIKSGQIRHALVVAAFYHFENR